MNQDFSQWKKSPEYAQVQALYAATVYGEKLNKNFQNFLQQKGFNTSQWVPIIGTLRMGGPRSYSITILNVASGDLGASGSAVEKKSIIVSPLSTDSESEEVKLARLLENYIDFKQTSAQLLNPSPDNFEEDKIIANYQAIFSQLKQSATANNNLVQASDIQNAMTGQTFLDIANWYGTHRVAIKDGVRTVFSTFEKTAEALAEAGLKEGLNIAKSVSSLFSVLGDGLNVAYSVFNVGLDVYQLVNSQDPYQNSALATRVGFDSLSLGLSVASIGAGWLAGSSSEAATAILGVIGASAATLETAAAAIGGVTVIATGLGIGITGLVQQFDENAKSVDSAGKELIKLYDAFKNGGYQVTKPKDDSDAYVLQPISGVAFEELDLTDNESLKGMFSNRQTIGESVPFHANSRYSDIGENPEQTAGTQIPLGIALTDQDPNGDDGYVVLADDKEIPKTKLTEKINFAQANLTPADKIYLVLPYSPDGQVDLGNLLVNVCDYNNTKKNYHVVDRVLKQHRIIYKYIQGSQFAVTSEVRYTYKSSAVRVKLGTRVTNIAIPEIPANLFNAEQASTQGFTYTLLGMISTTYAVYLNPKCTLILGSLKGEVDGLATDITWELVANDSIFDTEKPFFDKNGLLNIPLQKGSVLVNLQHPTMHTVILLDSKQNKLVADFTQKTIAPWTSAGGESIDHAKSGKALLDQLRSQSNANKGGIITLNDYIVNGVNMGRAWYNGEHDKILYTSTNNPNVNNIDVKGNALLLGADFSSLNPYFYCFEPISHLIWKTGGEAHEVLSQYQLMWVNDRSALKQFTGNTSYFSLRQTHVINDHLSEEMTIDYKLFSDKLLLSTILCNKETYDHLQGITHQTLTARLSEILGNSNGPASFNEGKIIKATLGPIIALRAADANKNVYNTWLTQDATIGLQLKNAGSEKGKNMHGVPNDLVLAGAITNASGQVTYIFFSLEFKTLYKQVEGEQYGQQVPVNNLTNVYNERGQIFLILGNDLVKKLGAGEKETLLGVGKRWLKSHNNWWDKNSVDYIGALVQQEDVKGRLILLLHISKDAQKTDVFAQGWFDTKHQSVLFQPTIEGIEDLRLLGMTSKGEGGWFIGKEKQTNMVFFQPVLKEHELGAAFDKGPTQLDESKIPNPVSVELPDQESIQRAVVLDGELMIMTAKHICVSVSLGIANDLVFKAMSYTPGTDILIPGTDDYEAWTEAREGTTLNEWMTQLYNTLNAINDKAKLTFAGLPAADFIRILHPKSGLPIAFWDVEKACFWGLGDLQGQHQVSIISFSIKKAQYSMNADVRRLWAYEKNEKHPKESRVLFGQSDSASHKQALLGYSKSINSYRAFGKTGFLTTNRDIDYVEPPFINGQDFLSLVLENSTHEKYGQEVRLNGFLRQSSSKLLELSIGKVEKDIFLDYTSYESDEITLRPNGPDLEITMNMPQRTPPPLIVLKDVCRVDDAKFGFVILAGGNNVNPTITYNLRQVLWSLDAGAKPLGSNLYFEGKLTLKKRDLLHSQTQKTLPPNKALPVAKQFYGYHVALFPNNLKVETSYYSNEDLSLTMEAKDQYSKWYEVCAAISEKAQTEGLLGLWNFQGEYQVVTIPLEQVKVLNLGWIPAKKFKEAYRKFHQLDASTQVDLTRIDICNEAIWLYCQGDLQQDYAAQLKDKTASYWGFFGQAKELDSDAGQLSPVIIEKPEGGEVKLVPAPVLEQAMKKSFHGAVTNYRPDDNPYDQVSIASACTQWGFYDEKNEGFIIGYPIWMPKQMIEYS